MRVRTNLSRNGPKDVRNAKNRARYANDPEYRKRLRTQSETSRKHRYATDPLYRNRVLAATKAYQKAHGPAKHRAKLETLAGRPRPSHCEACGRTSQDGKAIHWDHDHITGLFRGWLCVYCNHTLGKFEDDPVLLHKLIAYLEAPPGPGAPKCA